MSSRPVIEYYFSFISLWSYIGSRRLLALAEKHNAQIIYKPMDLMRVFSVSGGLPVKQRAPQRQAYRLLEMKRRVAWGAVAWFQNRLISGMSVEQGRMCEP